MVSLRIDLLHDVLQSSVHTNDEGDSMDPHKLATHKFLQTPNTVLVGNRMVFV